LVEEEVARGRRRSDPVEEEAARGREGSESGACGGAQAARHCRRRDGVVPSLATRSAQGCCRGCELAQRAFPDDFGDLNRGDLKFGLLLLLPR
jgi:hypothetical protein